MESFLSKIAEYTIAPFGRYIVHCKRNLRNLEAIAEELKGSRESLAIEVDAAKARGERIQPDVELWLTKVDMLITQTDNLLKDGSQAKLKCLNGFCPNLAIRRHLSRDSTKLVTEIVELYEKRGLISQVSCGIRREEVWDVTTRDYQAFQSRMSVMRKIMHELKNSETSTIGVYGLGGVGKTTLIKEVYRQAAEDKRVF